jgi:glycerophosphoryl diester phosphodiesterase
MLIGARSCIAHAGASAIAPSHTMAAYRRALELGADFVEPDLQLTRDGILVCLHDLSLERTTNVWEIYPERATEITQDGRPVKSWAVNDFTLEEIRRLDAGVWFDPDFAGEVVPTLQELIDLVAGKAGIYPETKDPDFYLERGIDIDRKLHELLVLNGLDTRQGQRDTPVLIQSFHESRLRTLKRLGGDQYDLIQLVWINQWQDFLSDEGLDRVGEYARGVSPFLTFVLGDPTLLGRAHDRGLAVHAWQAFEAFPPTDVGDEATYIRYLLNDVGLDGLFVHDPELCP